MAKARYLLGSANWLQAEAIGEPGRRTFRITLHGQLGTAKVWMEKEQLFELGISIKRLLASIPHSENVAENNFESTTPFSQTTHEFQLGSLALSYDDDQKQFILVVTDVSDIEELEEEISEPTVNISANSKQMADLAEEALEVCAAGRPNCPLCGDPIDPEGHICPRSNGHKIGQI